MTWTTCVFAQWSPEIGDPGITGWVTVAAYGIAAGASCVAGLRAPQPVLRRFWWLLAVLLLGLMINKQLDLQSALTATGRCLAKAQGWYDQRKQVQMLFILGLTAASVLAVALCFWRMRRHLPSIWVALVGLFGLLCFVAIRAAGFHHVDQAIGIAINNVAVNMALELGGSAAIASNAVWCAARSPRRRV